MITVQGVDQLERLARNLREAADHDLERVRTGDAPV
jgi:hypothetical protein